MRHHWILASTVSLVSAGAIAKPLQCNSSQTLCVVSDRADLTIGDRVGVFNADGELVATAEVSRMRGDRRSLDIAGRTGRIEKDHRIALLDTSLIDGRPLTNYKLYRDPSKYEVGASFGYATMSLGDSLPGYEGTAYVQMRSWRGLLLIGRMVADSVSAKTSYTAVTTERVPFEMSGFGLLGGVGYEWFNNNPLSLRVEAAVGAMHVSAKVDGDAAPVDDGSVDVHVKNGTAAYARWSIGGVYNVSDHWHGHLDFAQSLVYQSFANILSIGLSRDLQ